VSKSKVAPPAPVPPLDTLSVPDDVDLKAVTPPVATAAPQTGGPVFDELGYVHGSFFEVSHPAPPVRPGRVSEPPIPAFKATGEQMAAVATKSWYRSEQPGEDAWLVTLTGTPSIVRDQSSFLALSLTGGAALTAQLVDERKRRSAILLADLQQRVAAACKGLTGNERVAAAQRVHSDMVKAASDARDEARRRLAALLSADKTVGEVLLASLFEADTLALRVTLNHLAR
jgi:hypothetical protein